MKTPLLFSATLFLGLAGCSTGGSDGVPVCVGAVSPSLSIRLIVPVGTPGAFCSDVRSVNFDGKVRTQDGTIFVDTCGPAADCVPSEVQIRVVGPTSRSEDARAIPDGTFVHVVWSVVPQGSFKGCDDAVLVRNLPTWQGATNPTASHTSVWLFATNNLPLGSVGAAEDRTEMTVDSHVMCETDEFEPTSLSAITLAADDAAVSVVANTGERATLKIPFGAQKGDYAVMNDLVGVLGNSGVFRNYAIVRLAP